MGEILIGDCYSAPLKRQLLAGKCLIPFIKCKDGLNDADVERTSNIDDNSIDSKGVPGSGLTIISLRPGGREGVLSRH